MKYKRLLIGVIICFILIIALTNCKSRSPEHPQSREPQILKGQKIELSETLSAIDLEIIDSMLIMLCYGDQYKFHVYNKNTLEFIGKFGQEGRGPSEYMLPHIMSQKLKINDSAYLVIHDITLRRINFVNILKAINNVNYYPKSIYSRDRMLSQLSLIPSAVLSTDSLFVGISTDNRNIEGRFFCYNIINDKMSWEPFYPIPNKTPHESHIGEIYTSFLALRPDGKDIAAVALYFERIDVLDYKGKLKRSVIMENQDIQDLSHPSAPPKGSHQYFYSVSVSQDFIYALNIDAVVGSPEILDTAILVKVTWDEIGKTPETYKITPKVLKIEVDEESNRIFGLKLFSSSIYVYNMENQ